MFDFALSQSGDLIFIEKQTMSPALKLSFVTFNALKLTFNTFDFDRIDPVDNGIKLSFDIKDLNYNKRAMTTYGDNAKTQLLKIKLSTALNELPQRPSIGSKLELISHKPLYDQKVISLTRNYVKEAIVDILPNADVRVTPYVDKDGKYAQQLDIYIFENDFLIFQFSLEG